MRTAVATLLLALAAPAWAANYATCILDKIPAARDPDPSVAALRTCGANYPARFSEIKKGSGRTAATYPNAQACLTDKSKDTTYQPAAVAIFVACRCLYDKPSMPGATCAEDFEQR